MPPSTELILPDGARVKVDARGILVGRAPTAEVLLTDPSSSRRHALLYTDSCGLQLVPLGRVPVRVNGEATQEQRLIQDGDLLGFPGLELRVGQGGAPEGRRSGWLLQLSPARGASLEEARSLPIEVPCTAGGGPEDLLPLPRWPSGAVILEPGFPAGWRARLARGISLNGRAVGPERSVPLSSGDRLGYDGDIVRVLDASRAMQTTLDDDAADLPWKVELTPIPPAGGQITVHLRSAVFTAFIPGLRFDLLQLLLGAPQIEAGLGDDFLAPKLWGRNLPRDPKAVLTLVKRLRQDLDSAGLDGHALVERTHGGTRLVLAPRVTILSVASR